MIKPIRIGNTEQALRRIREADLTRRQGATTILSPTAVQGTTSPAKVLMTTIDGVARPLTSDDLARFRTRIAEVGTNLRAGITAREAIAMSRPIDLKRARDEIRFAVVVLMRGSTLRLATDSGPASKVARHLVEVDFPSFTAAVARPSTPQQAAAWLVAETPIRWDCSCEAHTFWFRYLASVGGWACGRKETGFPKIRNPQLAGACCKHSVRALDSLSSLLVRRRIAEAIDAARTQLDRPGTPKVITVRATQAQADKATERKTSHRIVVNPGQRGAKLPPPATKADVQRAIKALEGRSDISSAAILQALNNLINQPRAQGARK